MSKKELSPLDSLLKLETETNLRNFKKMLREPLIDGINYNKDAEDMITQALTEAASKGVDFRPAKPKGAVHKEQKHINELVAANPNLKAKELIRLADKTIIGNMSDGTFRNKVSIARKSLS